MSEDIIQLIDQYLDVVRRRRTIPQDEIVNMLLDLRGVASFAAQMKETNL